MLPQSNARVVKVERGGGTAESGYSADYDRPATDPEADPGGGGDDLWSGSVAAYYSERRARVPAGDTSRVELTRSLVVDARHPEIDFARDDTVTFEFQGAERTGVVQEIEERKLPGLSGTTRLTLEPATA
jgi:hypothetical protein